MAAAFAHQKQSAVGLIPKSVPRRRHGRRTLRRFAHFHEQWWAQAHDIFAQNDTNRVSHRPAKRSLKSGLK